MSFVLLAVAIPLALVSAGLACALYVLVAMNSLKMLIALGNEGAPRALRTEPWWERRRHG